MSIGRVKVGPAFFMLTFFLSVVLASIALYPSALHAYKEKQTGLDWTKVFTLARWDCGSVLFSGDFLLRFPVGLVVLPHVAYS
jgi:hypothetical protein